MSLLQLLISKLDRPWSRLLSGGAIFFLVAFFKAPALFTDPRFWAEEAYYYLYCRDSSLVECFIYTHSDTWQMLTNVAGFLATLLPIRYAPTATTWLTLLMHLVVVVQIVSFAKGYKLSFLVTIALNMAWALIPQSYEVWMTSTNIQWIAGVSLILALAMPTAWLEKWRRWVLTWALLCGASPAGCIVLCVFGSRAMTERKLIHFQLMAVTTLCVITQLIFVTKAGIVALRTLPTDPILLVLPTLLQSILAPVFSVEFAQALATVIAANKSLFGPATIGVLLLGLGLMAYVGNAAWMETRCSAVLFVLIAWVMVSIIQSFLAIEGPSWRTQINECPVASPCEVRIWPATWSLTFSKK